MVLYISISKTMVMMDITIVKNAPGIIGIQVKYNMLGWVLTLAPIPICVWRELF